MNAVLELGSTANPKIGWVHTFLALNSCFKNDVTNTYHNSYDIPIQNDLSGALHSIGTVFLFWKWRHYHIPELVQISWFENHATIAYPNWREFLVLKMTPLSHTRICVNFLFWKWRYNCIPKSAWISCFENDATTTYPNRHDFPVLKMTPLPT